MDVAYYITGHGYGHARRSGHVARALLAMRRDLTVHFRTTAPAALFADLPRERVTHASVPLDPGAVEAPGDALTIDLGRTAAAVREALARFPAVREAEARFLRETGVRMVLSDAPFLAGPIAAAAGVPCIAVTNFTWDWIYEPWFADDPEQAELVRLAGEAYATMAALIRFPFPGTSDRIADVTDVPLVATRVERPKEQILRAAGLAASDPRPRVLFGLRGGIPETTLAAAARGAPGLLFVTTQPVAVAGAAAAENVRFVPAGSGVSFSELLAASDVVISKLGYGTVADAIAAGTALLWPARSSFREDPVSAALAPRWLRMRQIGREDFLAGRWAADLWALLASPPPPETIGTDGAEVCARLILERMGG